MHFLFLYVLTLKRGGGGNWPLGNIKAFISVNKCRIDLKPGCKLKFVRCPETYLRKLIILGNEGSLQGPFLSMSLEFLDMVFVATSAKI